MNKTLLILTISGLFVLSMSGLGDATFLHYNKKIDNNPPDAPKIVGPELGKPGKIYYFEVSTTDPEGQNVSFYVEWENGTNTGWTYYYPSGEIVIVFHIWSNIDDYLIRCKAKDIYGAESNWTYLEIHISKNIPLNYNFTHLECFLEHFPMLERLMGLIKTI